MVYTNVRERLRGVVSDGGLIIISSIVLFELWYGVACSERRQENCERLRVFLSGIHSVRPFEEGDASIAGDLRATLEKSGTSIGPYNLLIAAQALRAGAKLVTANVREFARVNGLQWEDWSVEP
jgi:tRNA(fMet)-specific endonuclease VapC